MHTHPKSPSTPTVWPEWCHRVTVDGRRRGRIVARTLQAKPLYDVLFDGGARELLIPAERLRVVEGM